MTATQNRTSIISVKYHRIAKPTLGILTMARSCIVIILSAMTFNLIACVPLRDTRSTECEDQEKTHLMQFGLFTTKTFLVSFDNWFMHIKDSKNLTQ